MRRVILISLSALCAAVSVAPAFEPVPPGDHRCGYLSPVDGSLQFYHVYVPASYDPRQPAPVVFSLHGFGGRTGPAGGGWRGRWADANGWLLVRPDGRGNQNWDGIGEDDVFHVLADLRRRTPDHAAFNVDPDRLYAEGGSMGGHGAFRLATRHAGTFAAVAPVAGWTTYRDFYRHWYETAAPDLRGKYVDPSRLPLLETASSLKQARSALWCPMFVTYDFNDGVNPPWNARDMIRDVRGAGGVQVTSLAATKGHCGSYDIEENFRFFRGKTLNRWPRTVRLTTNTLRHNRAHWLTIERLRVLNQWAHVEADADGDSFSVTCRNVLAFGLEFEGGPMAPGDPIAIQVNNGEPIETVAGARLLVVAELEDDFSIARWVVAPESDRESHDAGVTVSVSERPDDCPETATRSRPRLHSDHVRKTHELSGPIDDAFRSRFTVIYGAQPGSRRGAAGADRDDAFRFAAEWNGWMTLHWRNERPPRARRDDWWVPPYPFKPGPHVHRDTRLVTPRPDTDFTLATLPRDRNLVLFGDPGSNWIVAQLAERLPLRISQNPANDVRVQCGPRVYAGDHVNYLFIAPNPLAPQHYVVVARGYQSSRIDPNRYGARQVGKDLEALPFYWPDYVVWDARCQPGPTVQAPLRSLPDAWLDAGFFGEDWSLCRTAPKPSFSVEGERAGSESAWYGPVRVRISAPAVPGGFGVAGIEYRVNDGTWTVYREPVPLSGDGPVSVSARALCGNGQYVYLPHGDNVCGVPAAGNLSETCQVNLSLRTRRSLWKRFLGLFGG